MSRQDLHFRLRLPEDLKYDIEEAAKANSQSMTAEIVRRLRDSFERDAIRETAIHLSAENEQLKTTVEEQGHIVQRLVETHETLTILAKAIADAFLTQGERSDVLQVLAHALSELKVDISTTAIPHGEPEEER